MPIEIQPIKPPRSSRSYDLSLGGEWDWLAKQEVNYNRAWASVGRKTRGKLEGGPTLDQAWSSIDPKAFTVLPPPPPLMSPILAGERLGPTTRLGTVELRIIDPFFTVSQATGAAIANEQPLVGDEGRWFDPGAFLNSKNIDLFGKGEVGVPARLTDYAFALPIALINKMNGRSTPATTDPGVFRFQTDPGYWKLLMDPSTNDETLRGLAQTVAGRYIDPYRNGYLVQQLYETFKADQDHYNGYSSGNERIDNAAKIRFAYDYVAKATANAPAFSAADWASAKLGLVDVAGQLVGAIPFIGAGIVNETVGISEQHEQLWRGLSVDERRGYLEAAGGRGMIVDIATMVAILPGLGAAMAVAKGSTGLAGTAFKAYDTSLRVSAGLMATGLTVATTNWALSAAWPEWSELLGAEIDRARPISGSALAGIVNEVGFWSSGTFGAMPAIQFGARTSGRVIGAGARAADSLGIPHPTIGKSELAFFRYVHGGSAVRNELARTGLSAQGIEMSVKASFLSHVLNWVERVRREPYEAALRGGDTPYDDINRMTFDEKQAWANDALARGMGDGPTVAEGLLRVLGIARRPSPINPSDALRQSTSRARQLAKTIDDMLAADAARAYGPDFIASPRVAGAYTPEAMEAWARAKVAELGGDASKLGKHDTEGWANVVRTLHQYEFHWWNGELAGAIEREALEEGARLTVVRSDHIFRNDADEALAVLRGGDEAAAAALVASFIRTKREAADWFARAWKPKPGVDRTPENVEAEVFAKWLEDITPALPSRRLNAAAGSDTSLLPVNAMQRKLDEQGTWTLAFKPADADGNLVSYARTSDGGVFKSPWVEYPLESLDNLELGNRGLLTSKLDSVFRGFRTWRISEFQRGGLFRSLTSRFDFLPEQIDQMHGAIVQIARDAKAQPQTVGLLAKLPTLPFATQTEDAITAAATRIFGKGPYRLRDGTMVEIDWGREVSRAYVQSLKLNLTAGLTSHFKARLGPIGALAGVGSDIYYVGYRFGMSPLFKGGELAESTVFNLQHGVLRGDPVTQGLFARGGGLGNDYSVINSEMAYDQLARGLGGGSGGAASASERAAASLSLHARRLPEDFDLQRATVSTQQAAAGMHAQSGGAGQVPDVGWEYAPGARVGRDLPPEYEADPALFASLPGGVDADDLFGPVDERGLWHTTTSIDSLYELGLLSRGDLEGALKRKPAHQAKVDAAREAYEKANAEYDTAYLAAKATMPDRSPVDAAFAAYEKLRIEADEAVQKGDFSWDRDPLNQAEAAWGAASDEFDKAWVVYSNTLPDHNAVSDLWEAYKDLRDNGGLPEGLGGSYYSSGASITTNHEHAIAIAERLQIASQAARGEVSIEQIIDHFTRPGLYPEDDIGALLASREMDGMVSVHDNWDDLIAEAKIRYTGPSMLYKLVQQLDNGLRHVNSGADGFNGWVGLVGDVANIAKIDPAQIGTVRVGIRYRNTDPSGNTIEGPPYGLKEGPDAWELQVKSEDLWVVDDRPILPALADTEDELLRQLKATFATEPIMPVSGTYDELNRLVGANGVRPGLETRARRILDRLEDIERAKGDDGPFMLYALQTPDKQAKIIDRLVDSGDLPPRPSAESRSRLADLEGDALANELADLRGHPDDSIRALVDDANESIRELGAPDAHLLSDADRKFYETTLVGIAARLDDNLDVWQAKVWAQVGPNEIEDAFRRYQRRPGATDSLSDIAGTAEAFEDVLHDVARAEAKKGGVLARAWETFWNPVDNKQARSLELQTKIMEREFPAILRASGNDGVVEVFRQLGIREDRWARWLLEDRQLLDSWMNNPTPESFDALLAHAGGDAAERAAFNELYASEEWATISALWSLNLKSAADEAFGTHFFMPYRSAFERSINHPVLGIYPASWSLKAAREWGKFLYDNRTFGDLRLGMAPAQAIAEIARAQAVQFAMTNDDSLDHFLDKGPLGSTLFIFNLLMPGDWSALPFPLSRTIREVIRGNTNPASLLQANLDFMGVTRDLRLFGESLGEARDLVFGPEEEPERAIQSWSVRQNDGVFGQPRR